MLIENLKQLPIWTINEPNSKKPLDVDLLSTTGQMIGFSKSSQLHTFDQLRNFPDNFLRAAKISKQLGVLVLDIEAPLIGNPFYQILPTFKPTYVEKSSSGGIHAIITLPQNFINDERLAHPNLKYLKYAEIFPSGEHFITFTFDQTESGFGDNGATYDQNINTLLDLFKPSTFITDVTHQLSNNTIQPDNRQLANQATKFAFTNIHIGNMLKFADSLNQPTKLHERDHFVSKWCLKRIFFLKQHYPQFAPLSDNDMVIAASNLHVLVAPHHKRKKWFSKRAGNPFIVYDTARALEYYSSSH